MSASSRRITPLTLGVISEPPCLVLFYEETVQVNGEDKKKRRKRKIPLRQFTDKSSVDRYAQNVRIRHAEYVENIPQVVIEKMLRIIQEIIQGHSPDEAAVRIHAEYSINPDEDLNKLSQEEVNRKKMIMDEIFEKNRLRPTDPGYQYDKQVDFSCKSKVRSGWDEDDDENAGDKDDRKINEAESNKNDTEGIKITRENPESVPADDVDNDDKIETFDVNDDEDYFW